MLNLPYAWFDLLRMMWPFGLGCLCRGRGGEGAGLAEKSISEASSTRHPSLSRLPSYRSRHVLVEEEKNPKDFLEGLLWLQDRLTALRRFGFCAGCRQELPELEKYCADCVITSMIVHTDHTDNAD